MSDALVEKNLVTLQSLRIYKIEYIEDSFVVTKGLNKALPPQVAQTETIWFITVGVNRQNSSPVAEQFNSKTGGQVSAHASHTYSPWAHSDLQPEQLNFFYVSGASLRPRR